MHRFYLPPNEWRSDVLVLQGTEAHHARNVLRMQPGDKAVLFNGRGREMTAEITSLDGAQVQLRKLHEAETPPLRCHITLAQAIPKGKNMDLIVQKAVEIGAAEIAPLISERTIVDLDPAEAGQKQAKWQQVAIEAAKQCGQNWLPQVHTPRKLAQFFDVATGLRPVPEKDTSHRDAATTSFDLQLIGSLQSDAVHLKKFSLNIRMSIMSVPPVFLLSSARKAISRRRNSRSRAVTAAARSHSAQLFFAWRRRRSTA